MRLQLDEGDEEIILPRINTPVAEDQRPGNLIKTIFIERHFIQSIQNTNRENIN